MIKYSRLNCIPRNVTNILFFKLTRRRKILLIYCLLNLLIGYFSSELPVQQLLFHMAHTENIYTNKLDQISAQRHIDTYGHSVTFLAPPAERQQRFFNADLSVVINFSFKKMIYQKLPRFLFLVNSFLRKVTYL